MKKIAIILMLIMILPSVVGTVGTGETITTLDQGEAPEMPISENIIGYPFESTMFYENELENGSKIIETSNGIFMLTNSISAFFEQGRVIYSTGNDYVTIESILFESIPYVDGNSVIYPNIVGYTIYTANENGIKEDIVFEQYIEKDGKNIFNDGSYIFSFKTNKYNLNKISDTNIVAGSMYFSFVDENIKTINVEKNIILLEIFEITNLPTTIDPTVTYISTIDYGSKHNDAFVEVDGTYYYFMSNFTGFYMMYSSDGETWSIEIISENYASIVRGSYDVCKFNNNIYISYSVNQPNNEFGVLRLIVYDTINKTFNQPKIIFNDTSYGTDSLKYGNIEWVYNTALIVNSNGIMVSFLAKGENSTTAFSAYSRFNTINFKIRYHTTCFDSTWEFSRYGLYSTDVTYFSERFVIEFTLSNSTSTEYNGGLKTIAYTYKNDGYTTYSESDSELILSYPGNGKVFYEGKKIYPMVERNTSSSIIYDILNNEQIDVNVSFNEYGVGEIYKIINNDLSISLGKSPEVKTLGNLTLLFINGMWLLYDTNFNLIKSVRTNDYNTDGEIVDGTFAISDEKLPLSSKNSFYVSNNTINDFNVVLYTHTNSDIKINYLVNTTTHNSTDIYNGKIFSIPIPHTPVGTSFNVEIDGKIYRDSDGDGNWLTGIPSTSGTNDWFINLPYDILPPTLHPIYGNIESPDGEWDNCTIIISDNNGEIYNLRVPYDDFLTPFNTNVNSNNASIEIILEDGDDLFYAYNKIVYDTPPQNVGNINLTKISNNKIIIYGTPQVELEGKHKFSVDNNILYYIALNNSLLSYNIITTETNIIKQFDETDTISGVELIETDTFLIYGNSTIDYTNILGVFNGTEFKYFNNQSINYIIWKDNDLVYYSSDNGSIYVYDINTETIEFLNSTVPTFDTFGNKINSTLSYNDYPDISRAISSYERKVGWNNIRNTTGYEYSSSPTAINTEIFWLYNEELSSIYITPTKLILSKTSVGNYNAKDILDETDSIIVSVDNNAYYEKMGNKFWFNDIDIDVIYFENEIIFDCIKHNDAYFISTYNWRTTESNIYRNGTLIKTSNKNLNILQNQYATFQINDNELYTVGINEVSDIVWNKYDEITFDVYQIYNNVSYFYPFISFNNISDNWSSKSPGLYMNNSPIIEIENLNEISLGLSENYSIEMITDEIILLYNNEINECDNMNNKTFLYNITSDQTIWFTYNYSNMVFNGSDIYLDDGYIYMVEFKNLTGDYEQLSYPIINKINIHTGDVLNLGENTSLVTSIFLNTAVRCYMIETNKILMGIENPHDIYFNITDTSWSVVNPTPITYISKYTKQLGDNILSYADYSLLTITETYYADRWYDMGFIENIWDTTEIIDDDVKNLTRTDGSYYNVTTPSVLLGTNTSFANNNQIIVAVKIGIESNRTTSDTVLGFGDYFFNSGGAWTYIIQDNQTMTLETVETFLRPNWYWENNPLTINDLAWDGDTNSQTTSDGHNHGEGVFIKITKNSEGIDSYDSLFYIIDSIIPLEHYGGVSSTQHAFNYDDNYGKLDYEMDTLEEKIFVGGLEIYNKDMEQINYISNDTTSTTIFGDNQLTKDYSSINNYIIDRKHGDIIPHSSLAIGTFDYDTNEFIYINETTIAKLKINTDVQHIEINGLSINTIPNTFVNYSGFYSPISQDVKIYNLDGTYAYENNEIEYNIKTLTSFEDQWVSTWWKTYNFGKQSNLQDMDKFVDGTYTVDATYDTSIIIGNGYGDYVSSGIDEETLKTNFDLNNDTNVDIYDIQMAFSFWHTDSDIGDMNTDGIVDSADIWLFELSNITITYISNRNIPFLLGYYNDVFGGHAILLNASSIVDIGVNPAGWDNAHPIYATRDASIITGGHQSGSPIYLYEGWVWTTTGGFEHLRDYIVARGYSEAETWDYRYYASHVSDDGLTWTINTNSNIYITSDDFIIEFYETGGLGVNYMDFNLDGIITLEDMWGTFSGSIYDNIDQSIINNLTPSDIGIYYAIWIYLYYPDYVDDLVRPALLSWINTYDITIEEYLDYNGDSIVEYDEFYNGRPSTYNLNTFYTEWYIQYYHPDNYEYYYAQGGGHSKVKRYDIYSTEHSIPPTLLIDSPSEHILINISSSSFYYEGEFNSTVSINSNETFSTHQLNLSDGNYIWKYKYYTTEWSDWSSLNYFQLDRNATLDIPIITQPLLDGWVNNPLITWSGNNTYDYEIIYSNNSLFLDSETVYTSNESIVLPLDVGTYYLKIRSVNETKTSFYATTSFTVYNYYRSLRRGWVFTPETGVLDIIDFLKYNGATIPDEINNYVDMKLHCVDIEKDGNNITLTTHNEFNNPVEYIISLNARIQLPTDNPLDRNYITGGYDEIVYNNYYPYTKINVNGTYINVPQDGYGYYILEGNPTIKKYDDVLYTIPSYKGNIFYINGTQLNTVEEKDISNTTDLVVHGSNYYHVYEKNGITEIYGDRILEDEIDIIEGYNYGMGGISKDLIVYYDLPYNVPIEQRMYEPGEFGFNLSFIDLTFASDGTYGDIYSINLNQSIVETSYTYTLPIIDVEYKGTTVAIAYSIWTCGPETRTYYVYLIESYDNGVTWTDPEVLLSFTQPIDLFLNNVVIPDIYIADDGSIYGMVEAMYYEEDHKAHKIWFISRETTEYELQTDGSDGLLLPTRGWNSVGIPLQTTMNITDYLGDDVNVITFIEDGRFVPVVLGYNDYLYENKTIDYGDAFWVHSLNDSVVLEISGNIPVDTSLILSPGFNMLAFPISDDRYMSDIAHELEAVVSYYDNSEQKFYNYVPEISAGYDKEIKAGDAYFLIGIESSYIVYPSFEFEAERIVIEV